MNEHLSPQRKAEEASKILDNPLFKEAFAGVLEYLDAQALACDSADKDKTQKIVVGRQMLEAVRRELVRAVESGMVERVRMEELKKPGIARFLR